MNLPKEFEYYLKEGIARKTFQDKPRAQFLIKESEISLDGLKERIKRGEKDYKKSKNHY